MEPFTLMLGGATIAKSFFDLAGSYSESQALKVQAEASRLKGQWEKGRAYLNAQLSDLAAEDATERGEKEAARVKAQGDSVRGSQRTSYAAQGVDVNSGSAAIVQSETDYLTGVDMMTVRANAYKEAFGYKTQARSQRYAGDMAEFEGNNAAFIAQDKSRATLLSGGINFATSAAKGASEAELFGTRRRAAEPYGRVKRGS